MTEIIGIQELRDEIDCLEKIRNNLENEIKENKKKLDISQLMHDAIYSDICKKTKTLHNLTTKNNLWS